MTEQGSIIACKNCRNGCRLVIHGVVTEDKEVYNLWQCDECGSMFRELAGYLTS